MKQDIPVISFIARQSGTGKTTLLERLIRIFKSRGYRLGVLKHDAHKFEIDKKGKDSWRFTNAGADQVMVSSSTKLAFVELLVEEKTLEDLLDYYQGVDFILIEGFKQSNYPKIEVHRKELQQRLLYWEAGQFRDSFLAVASDDESLVLPIPVLDLNEPEAIADFLISKFLLEE